MNKLGLKVKEIRTSNHLSQQQFAESLGYSHKSVINKIESGQRDMSYEKILLMVKVYGLNIKDLEDMMPSQESVITHFEDKKTIIYIHPKGWNSLKVKDIQSIKVGYEIKEIKCDINDVQKEGNKVKEKFSEILEEHQEIVLIASSMACFYAIEYLSSYDIKKAYFISPIIDMYQYIFDLMNKYHVTERKLKEEKFVQLEDGQLLSYDLYQHVLADHDEWKIPTDIIYGDQDRVVFIENIADFLAYHDSRLSICINADHNFSKKENQLFLKEWLIKQL